MTELETATLAFRKQIANHKVTRYSAMLPYCLYLHYFFKDSPKEKVPSNKIPRITESMNMDIWVVEIGCNRSLT